MSNSVLHFLAHAVGNISWLSLHLTRNNLPVAILGVSQDICPLEDHPFFLI